jgi:hypothetical protein
MNWLDRRRVVGCRPVCLTTEGADVKLARTLSAIGCAAALAGCHTCWVDRDDVRPMKYGSVRDGLEYGWGWNGYHPQYHYGPPDGIRDHKATKRAAIKAANEALAEQNCGAISRDFEFGFQQAFIDISNGGSGALPVVPPPRYWTAPYRTTWGHNKAREWFSGYEAGASVAKGGALRDAQSVPTSVYRTSDQQVMVGLHGTNFVSQPMSPAPVGWPNAMPYSAPQPMMSPAMTDPRHQPMPSGPASPPVFSMPAPPQTYSMPQGPTWTQPTPNTSDSHLMQRSLGPAPNSQFPQQFAPESVVPAPGNTPTEPGVPGGGWSIPPGPTPTVPPAPPGTGSPLPAPGTTSLPNQFPLLPPWPSNPATAPDASPVTPPPAVPQGNFAPSNPWGQFQGLRGFGFQPEGVSR